ncbi:hypothetical protein HCB18_27165 [Salinispora arenicola]|uniref:hypothetical protein n=1 Tax=Salinispora arenicola TaxID=168697 RepID=UPI0016A1A681|nr:hypothetical protein [Salinispora arenicola]NIL60026.1 hypothetical protein [Salinispora arenicola]
MPQGKETTILVFFTSPSSDIGDATRCFAEEFLGIGCHRQWVVLSEVDPDVIGPSESCLFAVAFNEKDASTPTHLNVSAGMTLYAHPYSDSVIEPIRMKVYPGDVAVRCVGIPYVAHAGAIVVE